jgi:hypothetical protein
MHPYFEPITMAERAQRARWMKAELEPDAQIPMLIDYISSPLGMNNAIWNVYGGGGFYSGFVIDCDATIIYSANWSWNSPGGKWWGLPLRPVEDLESFLDAYLANPPACYQPPGPSNPLEPLTPEGVASARGGPPAILIVDDDGGSRYESYFQVPLGNLRTHYQLWNVKTDGAPAADVLQDYRVVVWFTGDTTEDTLTAIDQANLAAYLDGGGKLFLSGQNIGQDIGNSAFYRDYLHATLINDDIPTGAVVGADILNGIEATLSGPDGAGNQTSPSEIGTRDSAVGVIRYDVPGPLAWGGLRWQGDYQVVYFAFGFEGIGERGAATFRFKIMKELLAWFDELPCPGDVDGSGGTDLADLAALLTAYGSRFGDPNFNPRADLDVDNDVDLVDLGRLLASYGCGG